MRRKQRKLTANELANQWQGRYINEVLQENKDKDKTTTTHPYLTISANAVAVLVSLMRDITVRVLVTSRDMLQSRGKKLLSGRDIYYSSLIHLSELKTRKIQLMDAIRQVNVVSIEANKRQRKFREMCRQTKWFARMRRDVSRNLANMVHYLLNLIIRLSLEQAKVDKKTRLTPNHIGRALHHDDELNNLFRGVTIPQTNVRLGYNNQKIKAEHAGTPTEWMN
ncbi:hypothetical protein SAMD00019534_113870 [Acytostelium subglobosum LB1]|uniref:hypothetical protein n=1 Tax=Acytostelium subglobosum LB1 TaxID=1410327 RepID=UPI000644C38F|nr:hypothetical protein SAMD00019534_113870 [Acytostelium subglobosum LB1]GAM28211.1 hypothetical protein SAMD00019534_113870 [Acytostelium subglobosum LB1]|eukprot:XP_012748845.1 hypothetical protein SAMD00019534_113870 [Acytostelium subglobosum LB1]